jgi:hypothetical protein
MNNLTQDKQDAKQAYLKQQIERTIAQYEKADRSERNAVIKHIDSFLSTESKESKAFENPKQVRAIECNEIRF